MTIPIEEIINFHKKRTDCHIQTLNYFAELLGYQFPEHDSDKYIQPYITGYAYYNYVRYHRNCTLLPQQIEAFKASHDEHHRMQPHHTEYYQSMNDVPDSYLIEMICDWHSANFEQNIITHEMGFASVSDFFKKSKAHLDWNSKQLETIKTSIDKISKVADYDVVNKIWLQLLQ